MLAQAGGEGNLHSLENRIVTNPYRKFCSCLNLALILGCLILFQAAFVYPLSANAASAAQPDPISISVKSGETVTLASGITLSNNLSVETGGILEIPADSVLVPQEQFVNYGTINIDGQMNLGGNLSVENMNNSGNIIIHSKLPPTANQNASLIIPYSMAARLIENGKVIVGGKGATDKSNLELFSYEDKFTLKTSDFNSADTLEAAQINKINIGDYGAIRFRSPGASQSWAVTIEGDSLAMGARTFDSVFSSDASWDESETQLATLHGGNDLTLNPLSGNTFTLTSGAIKAGAGGDPIYGTTSYLTNK